MPSDASAPHGSSGVVRGERSFGRLTAKIIGGEAMPSGSRRRGMLVEKPT
jgi:hypothetical protein